MTATDFLDEKRREIGARVKELKPLVAEYERLCAAAAALDAVTTTAARPRTARGSARRAPSKSSPRTRGARGAPRGRPKGSGTRAAEALALVAARPGITIREIADTMGIKHNYLYRVLPGLADEGLVVKEGKGWRVPKPA